MNWIISELYYPEETSTGHFLTGIARGLAQSHDISVICSQPTYSQRGVIASKHEFHDGIEVYRYWGTKLNKDFLPLRIINSLTISFSLFIACLVRVEAGDKVIVVTNPPFLPFLLTIASKIKKSKVILLVHDVYPEVLAATGFLRSQSLMFKLIQSVSCWLYNEVEKIITIGRDMGRVAATKCLDSDKIHVIENWADLDFVAPLPRGENEILNAYRLQDLFVLQYCGNMGRTHGLEYLVECAELSDGKSFHFLFIGSGAKKGWLENEVANRKLANVTVLPRCPRDELPESLNACDLAVISLVPGMSGVSVPSRMYNIMAAGKPILAIADADSELAITVREEGIGWVVAPGEVDTLLAVILDAQSDLNRLRAMGERARRIVEKKYSFEVIINNYRKLLDTL